MIVKWMAVLQRNGANQALITRLIDLKQAVIKSLTDLDMLTIHRIGQEGTQLANQYQHRIFDAMELAWYIVFLRQPVFIKI